LTLSEHISSQCLPESSVIIHFASGLAKMPAWSVCVCFCLSVCLYSVCLLVTTLHKRMNRSRCRLRRRLGWAHGTIHLVEPESPQANGQFWRISQPVVKYKRAIDVLNLIMPRRRGIKRYRDPSFCPSVGPMAQLL